METNQPPRGGTTLEHLAQWPELLSGAQALRPEHPPWVWEMLAGSYLVMAAPDTPETFATLADRLLHNPWRG